MLKKGMMYFFSVVLCSLILLQGMVIVPDTAEIVVAEEYTVQPREKEYVWYYKVVDGKTYRRLYCYSTGEWVTNWILCE